MSRLHRTRPLAAALAAAAFLALAPGAARSAPAADACYTCHLDAETPEIRNWKDDVHYHAGLTCADCHGGDPTKDDQDEAMSRARGYRGKIRKSDIPELCGQCHGAKRTRFHPRFKLENAVDSLMAGVHGEALRANESGPQCVSCHGVHDIARVSDPRSPVHPLRVVQTCASCHSNALYMRNFDPRVPVDQREKYLTSVHGKRNAAGDPNVATCVSCHSNHRVLRVKDPRSPVYATRIPATCSSCHSDARKMAPYRIPTDQYEKYRRSRHGIALLEKSDLNAPACNSCHGNHGAVPPGAASVVAVCGNCHQSNEELFGKSAHREPFEKKKLAGCVVCHGNHLIRAATDELVSLEAPAPCAECHRAGDPGKSAAGIVQLRALLDSLQAGGREANAVLGRAGQLGMDVSDARYTLKDFNQALVQSRVAIHTFRVADLAEVARPGLRILAEARGAGEAAIKDYGVRRMGLAVSTVIVTIVAFLLYLKIREIDRSSQAR